MASFVKAADAVAAAVEIERRGHKFYQDAQAAAKDEKGKEFFAFMAQEESRHEKIFQGMLDRLGGLELPQGSSEAEYLEYVEGVMNSHMLFTMESADISKKNPYNVALQFEKDTIIYFITMKDLVPESEQKFVQSCIDEEHRHIRLIVKKMKEA